MADADNFKYVLDAGWVIARDPDDSGRSSNWSDRVADDAVGTVIPSIIQQTFPNYHGVVWYWNRFVPQLKAGETDRVILHFGAADYKADVWLNGAHLGTHEDGETPFSYDVTDKLDPQGENLLSVRVVNPSDHDIDGLNITNVPNRNKLMTPRAGSCNNIGGLTYPVYLYAVPNVYVEDMFVQSSIHTGVMDIDLVLTNAADETTGSIRIDVVDHSGSGELVASKQMRVDLGRGSCEYKAQLTVEHPALWDIDDPHLYRVNVTVETPAGVHGKSVRHGFREFIVKDGFFYLNGRRIFLKSAHSGNAFPAGQMIPTIVKQTREDFIHAKSCGFNCIRCIAGMFRPEQLDLCDEIGMLVYDECFASWQLGVGNCPIGDEEAMLKRFDNSTSLMILRDRNHPCVVVWGMLNETKESSVFWRAVRFLPIGRKLDPSRLFILSSGRWDTHLEIGSVSNPGSYEWEYAWGNEGCDTAKNTRKFDTGMSFDPSMTSGDLHFYPAVPQSAASDEFMRSRGEGTRPIFLSEYGIGSQFNVIDAWKQFQQNGLSPDLEDCESLAFQSKSLIRDWKRFGLESVYPFPEMMLEESCRLSSHYRTAGFNIIRSNPNFCGYNLTGLLDHGMCGEGLWTYWRRFKPEMYDAVADGWSPLRWCLFATPTHAYAGKPFRIEAVLATEDALQPGKYPASFAITDEHGAVVWRQDADIVIPESMPFSVPVLKEDVSLDVPTGKYTLIANMNEGGSPTGSRLEFYITNEADCPTLGGEATVWGLKEETNTFLISMGLKLLPFSMESKGGPIIVGNPEDADDEEKWAHLMKLAQNGAQVLFLDSALLCGNEQRCARVPISDDFKIVHVHNWLYHKEPVATRSPIFDGLAGAGLMDFSYYDQTFPHDQIEGGPLPDEIICPCFYTGSWQYDSAYGAFHTIAAYKHGAGKLVFSTFSIEDNLNVNPAADRMLVNFVNYLQK